MDALISVNGATKCNNTRLRIIRSLFRSFRNLHFSHCSISFCRFEIYQFVINFITPSINLYLDNSLLFSSIESIHTIHRELKFNLSFNFVSKVKPYLSRFLIPLGGEIYWKKKMNKSCDFGHSSETWNLAVIREDVLRERLEWKVKIALLGTIGESGRGREGGREGGGEGEKEHLRNWNSWMVRDQPLFSTMLIEEC